MTSHLPGEMFAGFPALPPPYVCLFRLVETGVGVTEPVRHEGPGPLDQDGQAAARQKGGRHGDKLLQNQAFGDTGRGRGMHPEMIRVYYIGQPSDAMLFGRLKLFVFLGGGSLGAALGVLDNLRCVCRLGPARGKRQPMQKRVLKYPLNRSKPRINTPMACLTPDTTSALLISSGRRWAGGTGAFGVFDPGARDEPVPRNSQQDFPEENQTSQGMYVCYTNTRRPSAVLFRNMQ